LFGIQNVKTFTNLKKTICCQKIYLQTSLPPKWRRDIQDNDTQHNDTQPNDTQHNDTQPNDTQPNDTQPNVTQHNYTQHNDTEDDGLNCDTPH
jgi:hypothetical protein